MNTIFIILIVLLIICLLCSSIVAFFLKKKNDEEISLYNRNIDDYNFNYNINYENGKIYYQNDFRNMHKAMATVLTESQEKNISVNNVKIKLYVSTIKYEIINYINQNTGKITSKDNGKIILKKQADTVIEKPITVISDIITKIPLEKDMMFSIYYNYDTDRIAPPFVSEKYINYLEKKKFMFA